LLKLLADENTPKKLITILKQYSVDVMRLQDLAPRGISDRELVEMANKLERTVLTRDTDFTAPSLLSLAKNGVIYISCQFSKDETPKVAEKVASIANQLEPKAGLLIVVEHGYIEIYD